MIKIDRDWGKEITQRVSKIKQILLDSGSSGIAFGSSGGKDSALVGILCKMATDNIVGVIMPCESASNYNQDLKDAMLLGRTYSIDHVIVDLTDTKKTLLTAINRDISVSEVANINMNPRLRMATLYAIATSHNYLVAGTGNRSEIHMGYFTKWGDGAFDLNPIQDLTKTEIFDFLRHLNAPEIFYTKAPSAGLFEGQTDEADMGLTYDELDTYLLTGIKGNNFYKIEKTHKSTQHKRISNFENHPTM